MLIVKNLFKKSQIQTHLPKMKVFLKSKHNCRVEGLYNYIVKNAQHFNCLYVYIRNHCVANSTNC